MMTHLNYQVGGSLREGTETYVYRQADRDLYEGLKAGMFCYVLNSRQMGKSSLRVQTMSRLKAEGFVCVAFEMRELCVYQVSADEFYGGFVSHFASTLNLEIDLEAWWTGNALLHPFLRLSKFVEEVLLESISQPILVFVDEIDSILNLEFKDDFFAFVRSCYNKRADKPAFRRLTFALFGVATPTDLIEDKSFTPLNVDSRSIELTGFQLHEAQPLAQGLAQKADNPTKMIAEILDWTGGQPFLTQWVCQLVNESHQVIEAGLEAQAIRSMVRSQIIQHWLTHDRQQHFQTIRDRILNNKALACWSLGLYQQLLNQGELSVEDSPELMQFRLSGLVVKQQGKLSIYNRIYASVFDQTWTEQALRAIRPYGATLAAWEISKDDQYLLQDEALELALLWSKDLSLSHSDYQFLSASQTQELAIAESKTDQATQRLVKVRRETKKRLRIGAIALSVALLSTIGTFFYFRQSEQQLRMNADILNLEREGGRILQNKAEATQIKDLIAAMKSVERLKQLTQQHSLKQLPTLSPLFALQSVVSTVREQNFWDLDSPAVAIALSRNNQQIATVDREGKITIWTTKGKRIRTIKTQKVKTKEGLLIETYALSFSADDRYIAAISSDSELQIWNTQDGTLLRTIKIERTVTGNVTSQMKFTNQNQIIALSDTGVISMWNLSGQLLPTQQIEAFKNGREFVLSPEGDAIVFINAKGNPEIRDLKGQLLKTYPTITRGAGESAWHTFQTRNNQYISATFTALKFWNADGTLQSEIKARQMFFPGFAPSFDGSTIATTHLDGTLRLWTILPEQASEPPIQSPRSVSGDQQRLNRIQIPTAKLKIAGAKSNYQTRITEASLSPDGQTIAAMQLNGELALYRADGSLIKTIQADFPESSVKFSPDGSRIVLLSIQKKKLQMRSATGDLIKEVAVQHYKPGIEFSPDSKMFAIAGSQPDKTQLWSIEGQFIREIDQAELLYFSPNNQTYITVSAGITKPTRAIQLWTRSGQWLKTLSGHSQEIVSMGFSPTGQFMMGDQQGKLLIWSESGELLKTLNHGGAIVDIAHRKDGKQFATVGFDQTIKLWNPDGSLIRTLEINQIGQFQFSPNGQLLVAKTIDSTIHLWQADGTPITQIEPGGSFNSFLSFTPNSDRLLSSSDSEINSWNLKPDDLLQQGCTWLGDYLKNHPQELAQLSSCRS